MTVKPLKSNDFYFDNILNAVLSADGTVNQFDCHEFTMVWPSYTAIDLPDSSVHRLTPCKFNLWANEIEYVDAVNNQTVTINLLTGTKTTFSSNTLTVNPPPPSQQNWGWTSKNEVQSKKLEEPFKKGTVVFHKTTRTKWTYDIIDPLTKNYVFRSFYDKTKAMQIIEKDLNEFEELFF